MDMGLLPGRGYRRDAYASTTGSLWAARPRQVYFSIRPHLVVGPDLRRYYHAYYRLFLETTGQIPLA